MNWESLTPLIEKAINKVMEIKDIDERLAMLIFNVAEFVEAAERERFAQECIDLVAFYGGAVDLETAIITIISRAEPAQPDELPALLKVTPENILRDRLVQNVELDLALPRLDARETLGHPASRSPLAIGRNEQPLTQHVGLLDPQRQRFHDHHASLEVLGVRRLSLALDRLGKVLGGFGNAVLERHRRDEQFSVSVSVAPFAPRTLFVVLI